MGKADASLEAMMIAAGATVRYCNHAAFAPESMTHRDEQDDSEESKPSLLTSVFAPPATWVLGVETRGEANKTDWKAKSRRVKAVKAAAGRAFGPRLDALAVFAIAFHRDGLPIFARLTRLASRDLDRTVNLPSALKSTEDVIAYFLGINDGDPRWVCSCRQERSARMGVRIELSLEPLEN
jgi:hypothetical protein